MTAEETPGYLARDTVALLTPIANGKVLAAICALNACKCDVVEVPHGTLAIMVDEREGSASRAVKGVFALAKDAQVLVMERHDGRLTVTPWVAGKPGKALPPGLALDRAPASVYALMTGAKTIDEVLAEHPEKVYPGRVAPLRAAFQLRRLARRGRHSKPA